MKVLVTGGAGFIGGHLCELLLDKDYDVLVVDCVNDYYDVAQKEHTLDILQKKNTGKLQIVKTDLTDYKTINEIYGTFQPDICVHLAAQAGVRYSINNAMEITQTNINATLNLLENAKIHNTSNFVFASSSSVYGNSSIPPFSEDQICDKPISPYAASKRACELLAHTYSHLHNLHVTGLRFFTVYGPRGRPDMACYKFIHNIMKGTPIDKYGDGSAIRDFTYVSDIVNGIYSAMMRPNRYLIVNLGGGVTYSLNDLISLIERHCNRRALINSLPDQPGDVPLTSADQTVALHELDFRPQVSLNEGIARTVQWYKDFHGIME